MSDSTRPDAANVFALHRRALAALARTAAAGSGDLTTSLREMTELLTQILDVERASVWRYDKDKRTIECLDLFERGAKKHSAGLVLGDNLAPAYFDAVAGEEVIAAHDALADPRTSEFGPSYLTPLGITSMLDIPVFRGDELFGVICHEHVGPARTWTQWDELLGSSVADMLALLLNIADRIAAERALEAHQERLEALVEQRTSELRRTERGMRNVFEGAPVAVLMLRATDRTVLLANQRAQELFDVDPASSVPALDPRDLFCDRADFERVLALVKEKSFVEDFRAQLRNTGGGELWAEVSASLVTFEGSEAVLLGIHDVTKQKAAEETLRERNEILDQIFTAAPIPLVLTGLDDPVLHYCNARAAEMLGYPADQVIGKRAPDFYVDPESRAGFVERLRAEGRVEAYPALLKTGSGTPFWALMSAHTIDLAGERLFMVGFVNISRQKETEAQLNRLNESLTKTLGVLEERDRHIREDLEEARAFQQLILPAMPADSRLGFAALYHPTSEVGGDIYDVVELEPGRFRVFMADARGHGVQAALRTILLRSEYERVRREPDGPGMVLQQLNQRICSRFPGMHLQCTAACIDVTPDERGARVRYAAAANPPFLHVTAAGTYEMIASGPHLGVLPEVVFETSELHVARGERFLAYTDGLYEQAGPDGEMYGVEKMLTDMTLALPLDELPTRVLAALETFAGSTQLVDDVTLVAVEVS